MKRLTFTCNLSLVFSFEFTSLVSDRLHSFARIIYIFLTLFLKNGYGEEKNLGLGGVYKIEGCLLGPESWLILNIFSQYQYSTCLRWTPLYVTVFRNALSTTGHLYACWQVANGWFNSSRHFHFSPHISIPYAFRFVWFLVHVELWRYFCFSITVRVEPYIL
jgi:hypothetical protein